MAFKIMKKSEVQQYWFEEVKNAKEARLVFKWVNFDYLENTLRGALQSLKIVHQGDVYKLQAFLPEDCEMTSWARVASSNPGPWDASDSLELETGAELCPENKKLLEEKAAACSELQHHHADPQHLDDDRAGHSYQDLPFLIFYGEEERGYMFPQT